MIIFLVLSGYWEIQIGGSKDISLSQPNQLLWIGWCSDVEEYIATRMEMDVMGISPEEQVCFIWTAACYEISH